MGNKLYVGGLPYSVTDGRLSEVFSAHGTVDSARVVADKFTGQSRGFGYVRMVSAEAEARAIKTLHRKEVDGRKLVVHRAVPQGSR